MKRSRIGRPNGLPRDAEELLWLTTGLSESGSRAEDSFWEAKLAESVGELLASDGEETLTAALDHVYTTNPLAYDELADAIETSAEMGFCANEHVLLIAAPILAWSRFSIPANTIPQKVLNNLRVHLQAHVLADGVKLGLADVLFSPDQLPQGYCDTAKFAQELAQAAVKSTSIQVRPEDLPETARFLSDVRYIVGAVTIQPGQPIFRWQERDATREQVAEQWRAQGGCLYAALAHRLCHGDGFAGRLLRRLPSGRPRIASLLPARLCGVFEHDAGDIAIRLKSRHRTLP